MTKNIVIGLVAVAAVAGGGYWYMGSQSAATTEQGAIATEETSSSKSSLKSLLAVDKPQKCTVNQADAKGTVYIAKGKMRADFAGGAQAGHMIIEGNKGYAWADGQTQGLIIDINQSASGGGSASSQGQVSTVDLEKEYDYSCENWSEDPKMFEKPSTVTFLDISALLKQNLQVR